MKERDILFSGEMVRKIRAGEKWETRRLAGLEIINRCPDDWELDGTNSGETGMFTMGGENYAQFRCDKSGIRHYKVRCRYGVYGDLLWVKERFAKPFQRVGSSDPEFLYYADLPEGRSYLGVSKWSPSIHMPRRAARLTFPNQGIGIERVQSITKESVIAEGFAFREGLPLADCHAGWHEPFAAVWIKLNGEESWNRNPWVWVVKFPVQNPVLQSQIQGEPWPKEEDDHARRRPTERS